MKATVAITGPEAGARRPPRTPRNQSLRRLLVPVLPLVLATLLGAILTWGYATASRDLRDTAARAGGVLLVTQRVAILEETAETAERSFALTGDTALLDAFFPSLEALPATAQRLEALVASDPSQAVRAATVSDLVTVRARQMWEAVEAHRHHGARAARSAIGNPESRETDRRLTEVVEAMTAAERATVAGRQASVDRWERSILLVGLLTGALTLGIYGVRRMALRRALATATA